MAYRIRSRLLHGALGKNEEDRVRNLTALLDGYTAKDGHHLNINVFDTKTLLDAMEHPEEYPQLTIRVSGYAVNFIKLTREQQLDVINRTFHEKSDGERAMEQHEGRIHSIETSGMVDGPGIRFVVFMQGCLLRCQYCHNPDTWTIGKSQLVTVQELVEEIRGYLPFLQFSGAE